MYSLKKSECLADDEHVVSAARIEESEEEAEADLADSEPETAPQPGATIGEDLADGGGDALEVDRFVERVRARTRAGMAAVLGFSSGDPRRGRVLFTDARANPVLAARRAATQDLLRAAVLAEVQPAADPVPARVGAAMYTGAMAELAQQWLAGTLGADLDVVVDTALELVLGRD